MCSDKASAEQSNVYFKGSVGLGIETAGRLSSQIHLYILTYIGYSMAFCICLCQKHATQWPLHIMQYISTWGQRPCTMSHHPLIGPYTLFLALGSTLMSTTKFQGRAFFSKIQLTKCHIQVEVIDTVSTIRRLCMECLISLARPQTM